MDAAERVSVIDTRKAETHLDLIHSGHDAGVLLHFHEVTETAMHHLTPLQAFSMMHGTD